MSEEATFEKRAKEIEALAGVDAKLRYAIDAMRVALLEGNRAEFRDFWRFKKICLDLFKEVMHPTQRTVLWAEYTALLTQAHELQQIMEEQTNFHIEQIELAIEGLEKDIAAKAEKSQEIKVVSMSKLPSGKLMENLQRELSFLDRLKERILALRKDILGLEMRISAKNKILERLSKAGDLVFPDRKRLLQEFGKLFQEAVLAFASEQIDLKEKTVKKEARFSDLRDQIKAFQAVLKEVQITSDLYQKIKAILGSSWEIVSKGEKERRTEDHKERTEEKEKIDMLLEKLAKIEPNEEVYAKTEALCEEAKQKNFSKHAMLVLKKEISKKRDIHDSKIKAIHDEKRHLAEKKRADKDALLEQLLKKATALLETELSLEAFVEATLALEESARALTSPSLELVHLLAAVKERLFDRQESEGNKDVTDAILEGRVLLEEEAKERLNGYRGEIQKAGLDIVRVMMLKEMMAEDKARIVRLNGSIDRLILDLKG